MPISPKSPCSVPTCPKRAVNGPYCADHKPLAKTRRKDSRNKRIDNRPSAAKRGYDRKWQRVRGAYIKAHPKCVVCGEPAEEVDHIVPLSQGGTHKWNNLQSMCKKHHSQKTVRFDGALGNQSAAGRKPADNKPRPFRAYRPFATRTRDKVNRGSQKCIHVVGASATGKSLLLSILHKQLGIPTFSIDGERSNLISGSEWVDDENELRAWVALEDRVNEVEYSIVETSGHNLNINTMLDGRQVFTILCTASVTTRRERLKKRVDQGYALPTGVGMAERHFGLIDYGYVDKLMRIGRPDVPYDFLWDSEANKEDQIQSLLDQLNKFLSETNVDGRGGEKLPVFS